MADGHLDGSSSSHPLLRWTRAAILGTIPHAKLPIPGPGSWLVAPQFWIQGIATLGICGVYGTFGDLVSEHRLPGEDDKGQA
jgi:hypothetical protein